MVILVWARICSLLIWFEVKRGEVAPKEEGRQEKKLDSCERPKPIRIIHELRLILAAFGSGLGSSQHKLPDGEK